MEPMQAIMTQMNVTAHGSEPIPAEAEAEYEQLCADAYNATVGSLNAKDGYDCPICKNKGIVMTVSKIGGHCYRKSRDCKCVAIRNTIKRMMRSGLKDIISDYTFEKFESSEEWQRKIKSQAMSYAKELDGWFFIGGQSGSGKTHICTAICRELLMQGKEVRYMLWRDEIVKIKAAVTDSDKYADAIGQYKNAEVLYIDDLFKIGKPTDGAKQRPTSADINIAFEILNYRGISRKPTIISSECTISDLLEIDEALAGRIAEYAKGAISLKPDRNRNYRLKKATEG